MNAHDVHDTIAAIASAPGPGLRGIVRIAGPHTQRCLEAIFSTPGNESPISERQSVSVIDGQVSLSPKHSIPCQLLWWPTNKSYSRQPTGEIHTLGSKPLLQMLLTAICQSGARLAQPGEFTLRAFLSGRIDLTQAEAVLAVIDADGQAQFDTALQQLAGGLTGPLAEMRQQLLGTLAELEAGLDFVEEDIEFISNDEVIQDLDSIERNLTSIREKISNRDLALDAAKVVLTGLPNSGKSSLFNALTRSQQAIVTPVAGTTTDFISAPLNANSVPVELIDTAGAESTADQISQLAQSHRNQQLELAHVRLLCIDGCRQLDPWEVSQLNNDSRMTIVVVTKSDLIDNSEAVLSRIISLGFHGTIIFTSSVLSTGLDELRHQISLAILNSRISTLDIVGSTVIRTSESINEAHLSVRNALNAARGQLGNEIVAAELRQSLENLGQVVGTIYTDDILDLVFGRFCIGK